MSSSPKLPLEPAAADRKRIVNCLDEQTVSKWEALMKRVTCSGH